MLNSTLDIQNPVVRKEPRFNDEANVTYIDYRKPREAQSVSSVFTNSLKSLLKLSVKSYITVVFSVCVVAGVVVAGGYNLVTSIFK